MGAITPTAQFAAGVAAVRSCGRGGGGDPLILQ